MSDADMLKRSDLEPVIFDAGLLAVLIGEDRTMHIREEAVKMRDNFNRVDFEGVNIPGIEKYIEVVRLACEGSYIDPKVVSEIRDFQQNLENYRAIVSIKK